MKIFQKRSGKTVDSSKKRISAGKYYKKLSRIFIGIALLLSVFFISIFLVVYAQIPEKEQNAQQIFAQNRYNLVDTGIAVILNELSSFLKNPVIGEWADAQDSVSFYTKTSILYTQIKLAASQLGAISYEFAVVGDRFGTMAVSGLGTGPSEWFFKTETKLSARQIEALQNYSGDSDELLVMPVYEPKGSGKGDVLNELYFIKRLQWSTQKTLVLLKVSANPIFLPLKDENFCLIGSHDIVIYGRDSLSSKILFTSYFDFGESRQLYSDSENRYFARSLNSFPWQLISVYPRNNKLHLGVAIFLFGITLVLCLLLRLAAKKITGALYFPLNEVVLNSLNSKESENTENFDEFEILRNNSRKIELLSKELQETIEQKESLSEQKYYRGLIEGIVSPQDITDTTSFFVAQVLFAETAVPKERELHPWLQFSADAFTRSNTHMQYIQYGITGFVLLLQDTTQFAAKKTLKSLLIKLQDEAGDFIEMHTALSEAVCGKRHIYEAFNQTRIILEYRHSLSNQDILTANLIQVSANEFYYYPLYLEQKLLSLIIDGSPQTGACFDEIIDENTKNGALSPPAMQNLMYALAGTLARTLQELKATPENLYGSPIDWTSIYTRIPDTAVLVELRSIAMAISVAVHETSSQNDSKMLSLMEQYIRGKFSQDIQLQDLADQFNITPKYCSKLFSRLSNDTFKNYLNSFRVQKAKETIMQNPLIKITDLSAEMGFNSANSFIRVFSKYTGMSPKAWADIIIEKNLSKTEKTN